MEALPFEILLNVYKFSVLEDTFSSFARVSKYWNSVCESRYLLQYLVMRDMNLRSFPKIAEKQAKRILKNVKTSKAKKLEFVGFVTNGGVDENVMQYWCLNLFKTEGEAYCAHDNSENCVAGGVLIDSLVDPRTYFESEEDLKSAIDDFSNGQLTDVFVQMALGNALNYLGLARTHQHLIQQLATSSDIKIPQLTDVRRYPDNNLILQHNLKLVHAENSGFYAVLKGLKVARHGLYTCPVKSLIIFVSEEYVDVTDSEFKAYDNLRSYKKLTQRLEQVEEMPGVYSHFKKQQAVEYCEFLQSRNKRSVPVVWVKFNSANKVNIKLSQYFTGKYLYIKLLNPEDKRTDAEEGMNIDCRYVLPYGNIINLGKEHP